MPQPPDGPLRGYTVAVTADRRKDELSSLLERHGARVVLAPALRIIPLLDDADLRSATQACLDAPVDVAVMTTGIGFRGWLEVAEGWGLGDRLRRHLAEAYLVARGSKVRGALHAAGLADRWSPPSESSAEVLRHLVHLPGGLTGRRVVVQLHGGQDAPLCDGLREAGAEVVEVSVYRWAPPLDPVPLRRLVDQIRARTVDAVTFTSAPAIHSLLQAAGGERQEILDAFRADIAAVCVGQVTAAVLDAHGIPTVTPGRARLGAMVRALVEHLPQRDQTLRVAGQDMTIRGHAVLLGGTAVSLAPVPMAVLRALAAQPGRVLTRGELMRVLPRGADEHAVEMAIGRLRSHLGGAGFVETVVKRGYRLAVDEASQGGAVDWGLVGD